MVVFKRSPKDGRVESPAGPKGGASSPYAPVVEALQEHRDVDAVRLFLRSAWAHPLAVDDDMLVALREEMGKHAADQLVIVFATFPCPHCRSGCDTCDDCQGGGRGEDRRFACLRCRGMGVTACDFCGGSGF